MRGVYRYIYVCVCDCDCDDGGDDGGENVFLRSWCRTTTVATAGGEAAVPQKGREGRGRAERRRQRREAERSREAETGRGKQKKEGRQQKPRKTWGCLNDRILYLGSLLDRGLR